MISRIVGALVEPTPVVAEADADSLAIERNLVFALESFFCLGMDNQEKDEKQRQNDKTGLGMEK
ncbi:hypothetical protein Tco_0157128, partial [Tanacetum coccineum]